MRIPVALLALLAATACSSSRTAPPAPISDIEARARVQELVVLAAHRTSEAMAEICKDFTNGCNAMSSGITAHPTVAPGPDRPPTVLCSVGLPAGSRIVVLAGKDSRSKTYVSQVLLTRSGKRLRVHEPAFWLGISYTSLHKGLAWSGALTDAGDSDPPSARRAEEQARRACTDTAAWVDEVAPA